MIPIDIELEAIRERQRELWREADVFRLGRVARAGKSELFGRVCNAVGGWLIVWGARLQQLTADIDAPSRPAVAAHSPS